jgi:hypothetical protein
MRTPDRPNRRHGQRPFSTLYSSIGPEQDVKPRLSERAFLVRCERQTVRYQGRRFHLTDVLGTVVKDCPT